MVPNTQASQESRRLGQESLSVALTGGRRDRVHQPLGRAPSYEHVEAGRRAPVGGTQDTSAEPRGPLNVTLPVVGSMGRAWPATPWRW